MKKLDYMYKTEMTKREKIISCHGHVKAVGVSKMFGVYSSYVSKVWKDAGCLDDEDDEDEYEEWLKTQKCI